MKVISVEEAKKKLEKILKEIEEGEEIILKIDDKEFVISPKIKRKLGLFKGKVKIEEDIDKPLPKEKAEDFYK
ncbi:type II toxin-antitoxin system Phd/YefM family antitoxin [Persephonella sp.]